MLDFLLPYKGFLVAFGRCVFWAYFSTAYIPLIRQAELAFLLKLKT